MTNQYLENILDIWKNNCPYSVFYNACDRGRIIITLGKEEYVVAAVTYDAFIYIPKEEFFNHISKIDFRYSFDISTDEVSIEIAQYFACLALEKKLFGIPIVLD